MFTIHYQKILNINISISREQKHLMHYSSFGKKYKTYMYIFTNVRKNDYLSQKLKCCNLHTVKNISAFYITLQTQIEKRVKEWFVTINKLV